MGKQRKIVLATLAVILAALGIAALAGCGKASARSCGNECIYYQGSTGQPGWFEAKWVTNANHWYIRGVAKCGNGTRNTILQKGGWVKSIGLYSRATCTSSYPNLAGAAYDVKHCGTCSFTRTWVTIPPAPARPVNLVPAGAAPG